MASALQKLFRKKLHKQLPATDGRIRTARDDNHAKANSAPLFRQGSDNERQYLTVSSLNSPSLASVHRGSFSSTSSALPTNRSHVALSRTASNHSAFRNRANSVDISMLVPGQIVRPVQSSDDITATIDQFGSILITDDGLPTPASNASDPKDDDEEDDVQNNGFYRAIMDKIEVLSNHDDVKVILVPSASQLNGMKDNSLLNSVSYMSLYAFAPSTLFKDRYQSVRHVSTSLQVENFEWSHIRTSATLQPEARSVSVVLKKHIGGKRKDTQEERTLNVLSETIVYRSQSSSTPSPRKRDRRKIRVLLVDGFVATEADAQRHRQAKSTVSDASSKSTIKERPNATARLVAQEESTLAFPATPTCSTNGTFRLRNTYHIETSRNFLSDYLLLADPPASLLCLSAALKLALETIKKNSSDFTKAYVYVPGFDSYNASRIRRGILAKAWHVFVDEARKSDQCNGDVELSRWLGNEGRTRLLAVFENVVLGHCHSKIYMSIRSLQLEADDKLDLIIAMYHDHDVSLADFGIVHGLDVSAACLSASQNLLRGLGEPEEDLDWSLKHKSVSELREMAALSCPPLSSATVSHRSPRFRLRTPLDVLDVMQATLDDINGAAVRRSRPSRTLTGHEQKSTASSIGTDELIPILAFLITRAMPRKLMSLLYYTRLFGISDATSAKHSWTLTTFEAVAQYLSTDPLTLCGRWGSDSGAHSTIRSVERTRASVSMQRAKSAGEQQKDRIRRASLPTGIALAAGRLPSTRASKDSAVPIDVEESAIFKQPDMPASQATEAAQRRAGANLSRSSSQHKVLDMASGPLSEELFHKRTLSMSSDLRIRPQIVVRGAPSGRSHSRSSISSRPLLTRNISSAISVATNEAEPNVDLSHRRKSASESWSLFGALSGYGGSSKASLADEVLLGVEKALSPSSQGVASSAMTNDRITSEGRSPATSSSNWLPTWAHEWSGMSRAASSTAIERHDSFASTSSRPHSVLSQESNGALGVPIHVGRSNRSASPLSFPNLDSMPSLDGAHQQSPGAESRQDNSATICSSPREPSSLLSSPSSALSSPTYKSDQVMFKTNRGSSWSSTEPGPVSFAELVTSSKRTKSRGRVRSRLLSSPMPSAPLPPQVSQEAARADVSVTGSLSLSGDSVDKRMGEEGARRRPRPIGTLSADQIVRSSVEPASPPRTSVEMYRRRSSDSNDVLPFPSAHRAVKLHDGDVVRREPLQSAPPSFLNTTVNANAWPTGQPLHTIKLQIPSPVDERTDPMTMYRTHV